MPALPVIRNDLPRHQQLLTPQGLAHLLANAARDGAPARRCCVLEVGCGAWPVFLQSHIPGAAYLDTQDLEEEPFWNKVADRTLLQVLLRLGIRHDTTVIVYGRHTVAAARAAHLMLYAGVIDVRLLDGGFPTWVGAGLPCVAGASPLAAVAADFGAPFPGCPHYLVNLKQAQALRVQSDGALVSIRTRDEFLGRTSGYSYIHAKGDIPGARWGHAGQGADVNDMADFLQPDGRLRSAQDICQMWHDEGIHPGLHIAFYCGTGWRASLAFYCAWLMGWERISVFDGGWFEWSHAMASPAGLNAPAVPQQ